MTGAQDPVEGAGHPALLAKLISAVRSEFRAEPLVFAIDDVVFGGAACRVAGCPRTASGHGLCQGHHGRWQKAGRPDVVEFAATTDPRWKRERPNGVCRAAGCGFGIARQGLCPQHWRRWERSGSSDLTTWLTSPPPIDAPAPGAVCPIVHCNLWPQGTLPFCHSHANTWKLHGRGAVDAFAATFDTVALPADESIRLDPLTTQLRLEMQYALQCRHTDRTAKLSAAVVNRLVRFLVDTNATSLLDHPELAWRTPSSGPLPTDSGTRALLLYAQRKVHDLAYDNGWDAEYARPVWQLRRLGYQGNETFSFEGISQPWLTALVKRWLR